uniref:Uncharacterized protein n=1 Tax=Parastrongyloides trichosuri TaxID=131310 RepID=A0A0N4Z473_PARTI
MAKNVVLLNRSLKNEKSTKKNSNENFNNNIIVADSKKKTGSEIQSDNLLKDVPLFKDTQAEEEKLRTLARKRGVDEDRFVFLSMKKTHKSLSPEQSCCSGTSSIKDIDKQQTTLNNLSSSKTTLAYEQAKELLDCDILHRDVQAEEDKKKEEARKRGLDPDVFP